MLTLHRCLLTVNQNSFGFYWTKKSVDLARTLIEIYTKSSEAIFDPFMGSGSTILGSIASNGNRLAIGVEINELPIRNLQATTGMFDQTVAKEQDLVTYQQQDRDKRRLLSL